VSRWLRPEVIRSNLKIPNSNPHIGALQGAYLINSHKSDRISRRCQRSQRNLSEPWTAHMPCSKLLGSSIWDSSAFSWSRRADRIEIVSNLVTHESERSALHPTETDHSFEGESIKRQTFVIFETKSWQEYTRHLTCGRCLGMSASLGLFAT
jgi:hypothetical protein